MKSLLFSLALMVSVSACSDNPMSVEQSLDSTSCGTYNCEEKGRSDDDSDDRAELDSVIEVTQFLNSSPCGTCEDKGTNRDDSDD